MDEQLFKGQKSVYMIFTYEIVVQLMIKQLQLGFELELYHPCDYPFVFFYLEYLTTVLEKNRVNYYNSYPPKTLSGLVNKTLNKKKKQLNDIQEKFFYEMAYWKGLNILYKAYARLFYVLGQLKLIQIPQHYENRYTNRLKIFEYCYFIKPITFSEFNKRMEETYPNDESLLTALSFIKDQLKEAQSQFQSMQIDEKTLPQSMAIQQKDLIRLCVTLSVYCMKIQMNAAKLDQFRLRFVESCLPHCPLFELQQ